MSTTLPSTRKDSTTKSHVKGKLFNFTIFSKITKSRSEMPPSWIFDNIGYYDFSEQKYNFMDYQDAASGCIDKIVFGERINGVNQGKAISPEEIYAKIITKKILEQKHLKGKIILNDESELRPILKNRYDYNMSVISENNEEFDSRTNKSNIGCKSISSGSVIDSLK